MPTSSYSILHPTSLDMSISSSHGTYEPPDSIPIKLFLLPRLPSSRYKSTSTRRRSCHQLLPWHTRPCESTQVNHPWLKLPLLYIANSMPCFRTPKHLKMRRHNTMNRLKWHQLHIQRQKDLPNCIPCRLRLSIG